MNKRFKITASTALLAAAAIFVSVVSGASAMFYTKEGEQTGAGANVSHEFNSGVAGEIDKLLGEDKDGLKTINVIPEDAPGGSTPDPTAFKKTSDPQEVMEAAKQAQEYGLIKLDELCFSPDVNFTEGYEIEYYLDETIFVICWREDIDGVVFNFSEVGIAHSSQLRRYFANDTYASSKRLATRIMAKKVKAVVAINADFYAYRDTGIIVYQGKLYRNNPEGLETCYIDANGDFIVTEELESGFMSDSELQSYIDENNIRFSISFGPVLVRDGVAIEEYPKSTMGAPDGLNPRAAIGQLGELHYLLCTGDGAFTYMKGTTILHVAQIMANKNCIVAYNLDGGQTTSLIFNGETFNHLAYGERQQSDIIYFASAAE